MDVCVVGVYQGLLPRREGPGDEATLYCTLTRNLSIGYSSQSGEFKVIKVHSTVAEFFETLAAVFGVSRREKLTSEPRAAKENKIIRTEG